MRSKFSYNIKHPAPLLQRFELQIKIRAKRFACGSTLIHGFSLCHKGAGLNLLNLPAKILLRKT
ncbi:MAG: hypothetical protein UY23_C0001G0283 [Candidatus Jorgensenbacteria bacterium GW2011_GWA1_48_11]|uniref:Uncharacterized protein n=1 Tax=Candidatus Jorgensenbacteria bacterium GW2011_GWA1_48_11 TaxID=1618660 RepID=A0A0G1UC28_9BACT|nr:MAG: hypothetical protein UY23_C0001G0283 [Candidatus Jorgensenbacteria bacterium GW2011_GWA1_48_11]KKW12168.1 MAG: hypothetical protein UY51_C0005G0410 [Candidatus Jorgensenbacteria bacterium GW2011_GWB1_49_9]